MKRGGPRTALIRAGFAEPSTAEQHVTEAAVALGRDAGELIELVGARVADPDQAVEQLARILRDGSAEAASVLADLDVVRSALVLLGASSGLADFFHRHPRALLDAHEARDGLAPSARLAPRLAEAVTVPSDAAESSAPLSSGRRDRAPTLSGADARNALRICYRTELAKIAAYDLWRDDPVAAVPDVANALAALAGAAFDAALAVAHTELTSPAAGFGRFAANEVAEVRFAVIGMGKAGAEELNYLSDVDVMFVVEANDGGNVSTSRSIEIGTRLAAAAMRVIDDVDVEPALWDIDANLRPEGKDGALVRTVDSYVQYYERWAKNWEFQALLKARPIAGDLELGRRFVDRIAPYVWASASRSDFVGQARAMRERVTENIPRDEVDQQLKLGPGGLRDIEFTVQLLQLTHGQRDVTLRVRGTLEALERLRDGGYIGVEPAERFAADYRFLRLLEHRVQLRRLRRTHLMPRDAASLRALARATGFHDGAALTSQWQAVKVRVRGLHEQVFYAPLIQAVAALPSDHFVLTSEQALERLRAVGYRDPKGALAHLQALIRGVSRRAQLQRNLLPVLLDWFAQGADPDQGLLAFRRLSEQLGEAPWYLRTLRDSQTAAQHLTTLLSGSKFAAVFFELHPEAVKWLDGDRHLQPRPIDVMIDEMRETVRRHDDEGELRRAIRTFRRREVLRLAIGAILQINDIEATGRALADVATVTLRGAYLAVLGLDGAGTYPPFAIIAVGRYGGAELGFGSDLDVLYVYDTGEDGPASEDASRAAKRLVNRIGELLTDPRLPLDLDADLRPEGKSGPLVRSLAAYRAYYEKWSLGWEAQALLRARDVVGDADLRARFIEIADRTRYPRGLSADDVREIRRIKARVESERLPRGADPARHLKLGRGSLSDVEWLVQLLQLQHAHDHPTLRTTSTIGALEAACDAGLIDADDTSALRQAWTLASRVRSAVYLHGNRQSDVLPTEGEQLDGVNRLLGHEPGQAQQLEELYLATTRRARWIFERHFYGEHEQADDPR
ncbi:glutamate-ammonia-ligase adenylyltransferase [Pseudoclavibacter endophyticus]|uniref:Bifunctional [glutamine synthetase] adenylyltransferase/[glutamine synthetase]-adenylyl-L-tyrosine phosphorylase n=1 Tax=Pseudoclavibacter endophyticus TaxID=1778590 RepID=A0A6H9WQN2_9MICO|nr:bifunctional [glutamine synthetase] adenylyltransferase/[glutamine synthetase]-adenylyl-L-tyrosine phosphorylase [Pseudoclavibacter endophyticus]KAB1650011.1 bifunctional [glutamine synthetase] adenylyltransferase/[glutamine synthetase]-adenylyl-L-tyrosine phosphorylase [Pseudoclavibacter endophyticus]GGA58000.1 glutamate-ammonia-ligase adenylyltransferase [Pseudoclavibacter endophyticus]